MKDIEKNEDLSICSKCGGMCCKKSGCDYSLTDFKDGKYITLLDELNKGDKSIVAMINFRTLINGKFIAEPYLYIRARNTNRGIVDLISMKTRCSQLTDTGCSHNYENRPLGGRNLKPSLSENGPCRPIINPYEIANTWKGSQKQLRKVVKHFTGMIVEDKIKEDIKSLLYNVAMGNFEEISPLELEDLKSFVPLLVKAFPEEAIKVKETIDNRGIVLKRKL